MYFCHPQQDEHVRHDSLALLGRRIQQIVAGNPPILMGMSLRSSHPPQKKIES
jgi:hypothetical protein